MRVLKGRHAFISYAAPETLPIAVEFCQSFALDNGAFSVWRQGMEPEWSKYYDWVADIRSPNLDWAIIPDVIDGNEEDNDKLLNEWPLKRSIGVPVYHLHESLDRLRRLVDEWDRIALGSSGAYDTPNTTQWWMRINQIMDVICDCDGYPRVKVHGLRMLNPEVFGRIPLSSADSTNVCQNKGIAWRGRYEPATAATKAVVIAERIEMSPHAVVWNGSKQQNLFSERLTAP
jgi:hypothetical protein